MGVVYTPENIRENHIPEPGAHRKAGKFILERLAYNMDVGFYGAMIYGSTVHQPTRRSDLDVLAVFNSLYTLPGNLDLLADIYKEAEDTYHVRTEGNVIIVDRAEGTVDCDIDPLFGAALKRSAANHPEWQIKNPASYLPTENITAESAMTTARKFAAHKERRFLKSIMESANGNIDFGSFQRALELPSSLGRKAIDAIQFQRQQDEESRDRAWYSCSAETILESDENFNATFTAHRKLQAKDSEYSELLEDTITGSVTVDRYEYWLARNYRPAVHDARILASAWKGVLQKISAATNGDAYDGVSEST